MRELKKIILAALAAIALTAFGAGTASATKLEVGGTAQHGSVVIIASLKAGRSAVIRDTLFVMVNTCTESDLVWETEKDFTTKPTGEVFELLIESCENSITVHDAGAFAVEWTSGTNGRIYSEGAELTVFSSIHNTYITCTTAAAGTLIGTLTGVSSGNATIGINATINCGEHLSSAKWQGEYTVTFPSGLGVVS